MNIQWTKSLSILLVLTATIIGCTSSHNRTWTDYDTEAVPRMGEYRTFAWLPPDEEEESGELSEIDIKRLEKAIEQGFLERGYESSTVHRADFLIGYYVAVERGVERRGSARYGVGFGGSGGGIGIGFGGSGSRVYAAQTIVIDIVDPDLESLVWRGTAERDLKPASTPEQREEQLKKVVHDILKRFPPSSKRRGGR